MTGGAVPARAWREIITAAKTDPTPSPSALVKGDSMIENDFSHMLGSLMSEPLPSLSQQNPEAPSGSGANFAPNFTPDKPGDKVGYRRLND